MFARLMLSTGLVMALATCGSSSSGGTDAPATKKDSTVSGDAATSVITVACPATPDAEISNVTGAFVATPAGSSSSSATITVGQIVQFTTTSEHDATPNTGVDPGVHVGFNQSAVCKKFTTAGTFTFHCSIHQFMGTVVVN